MMGNLYQVLDNVLVELKMKTFIDTIVSTEQDFYIIEFRHKTLPDTYLKAEVPISPAGEPFGCVLERKNVGRKMMARIMDSLMYHLTPENMRD